MTKQIITFNNKAYLAPEAGIVQGHVDFTIDDMTGAQLLELYNLVSSNLGRGRVKRFADTKSAIRRTWTILQEYDAQDEGGDPALVRDNGEKVVDTKGAVTLSESDKAQIASEAASRPPAPKSEQLLQAAAAARKEPTTGGRGNIWRRAKHENVSKVAYRPEAGTVQGELYALLTRPGGITMEDYCEAAQKIKTKDATLFTPSSVWGALRYLFVTNRGYGLNFDGTKLQLIVPQDERQSSRKLKREG